MRKKVCPFLCMLRIGKKIQKSIMSIYSPKQWAKKIQKSNIGVASHEICTFMKK
jgi:hypothetical protein